MKVTLVTLVSVIVLSPAMAFAQLVNPEAPAAILPDNPELVEDFVSYVNAQDFSATTKNNLAELARSDGSDGDALLEKMNEEALCLWYGTCNLVEDELHLDDNGELITDNDGQARLYDAALVGNATQANYEDCRKRDLCIVVSKSEQKMYAWKRKKPQFFLARAQSKPIDRVHGSFISTARNGKTTPSGYFNMEEVANGDRRSIKYPGAVLFWGMQVFQHIFIHATSENNYPKLGTPASAGCVRTTNERAYILNQAVREIAGWQKWFNSGQIVDESKVRVLIY